MKTFIYLKFIAYSLCFLFLISCSSDEVIIPLEKEETDKNPKMEIVKIYKRTKSGEITTPENPDEPECPGEPVETYVRFRDKDAFEETLSELSDMTPEEQKEWASENLEDFVSIKDIHDQAMEEAESYYDREGGYEEFKEKYPTLYYPEEGEDYGAYIPFQDELVANVLNEDGKLMIGEEIIEEPRIEMYDELLETGRGYYIITPSPRPRPENPPITQNPPAPVTIYAYKLKVPGGWWWNSLDVGGEENEFNTGWMNVGNGKRIKIRFGRLLKNRWSNTSKLYLRSDVSFRKKGFLGMWYNYSSETSFQAIVRYDLSAGLPFQICNIRHKGVSSHDGLYNIAFKEVSPIDNYRVISALSNSGAEAASTIGGKRLRLFYFEGYTVDITVTYQGMTQTLTYRHEQPAIWGYTGGEEENLFR